MNTQLMSWTTSLTHANKWDRLTCSKGGTYIVGWVSSQDNVFDANFYNATQSNKVPVSKKGFESLEDAKAFVDDELKKQGYKL
jgi:hypothetical protein